MFRTNEIKGRVLPMLDDEDLRQLGVAALGDRKYLLHIFKQTKIQNKVQVCGKIHMHKLVSVL